jgi:hypothetical protein
VAFLGLGATAEAFLRAAAAAGTLRLESELGQIVDLEAPILLPRPLEQAIGGPGSPS